MGLCEQVLGPQSFKVPQTWKENKDGHARWTGPHMMTTLMTKITKATFYLQPEKDYFSPARYNMPLSPPVVPGDELPGRASPGASRPGSQKRSCENSQSCNHHRFWTGQAADSQ